MTLHASPNLAPACVRHQDALLDFVDSGEAAPGVGPALSHLEACAACTRDLAATALVLTALRRMFDEARVAETPPDAWPRLRERVTAPRSRRWAPGTISGLLTGAALVAALLLPNAARLNTRGDADVGGSGELESLRMMVPGGGGLEPPSMTVHLDRANALGSTYEVGRATGTGSAGPYPDNLRPVRAITASADADQVRDPALRPV